jgi:hypothetical protein
MQYNSEAIQMAEIYVYSTLSNDQRYVSYRADVNGVPQAESSIFIAGGANLMNKHFITPLGVATKVTAEQLAELKRNELFKLHEANGFITYSEKKEDPEQMAAVMTGRDQSAPIVDADEEAPEPKARRGRKPRVEE